MSDKSLTLDAAAEIDRYTKASIAKINENANELDSRIKVAQGDIEELLHDLSIARAGVDGINSIIGKVVALKSASDVKMTAARMADDGGVLCVWMHNGVVQSASIPLAALADWP